MQRPGASPVDHIRRTSCLSCWPRGFGALNSSPHSWIFTTGSVGSSPRSYLFTFVTGRKGVHTAPKYGTKPLRYVTLHFRDRRGTSSLRHRNRAATTMVMGSCYDKNLIQLHPLRIFRTAFFLLVAQKNELAADYYWSYWLGKVCFQTSHSAVRQNPWTQSQAATTELK